MIDFLSKGSMVDISIANIFIPTLLLTQIFFKANIQLKQFIKIEDIKSNMVVKIFSKIFKQLEISFVFQDLTILQAPILFHAI